MLFSLYLLPLYQLHFRGSTTRSSSTEPPGSAYLSSYVVGRLPFPDTRGMGWTGPSTKGGRLLSQSTAAD